MGKGGLETKGWEVAIQKWDWGVSVSGEINNLGSQLQPPTVKQGSDEMSRPSPPYVLSVRRETVC